MAETGDIFRNFMVTLTTDRAGGGRHFDEVGESKRGRAGHGGLGYRWGCGWIMNACGIVMNDLNPKKSENFRASRALETEILLILNHES